MFYFLHRQGSVICLFQVITKTDLLSTKTMEDYFNNGIDIATDTGGFTFDTKYTTFEGNFNKQYVFPVKLNLIMHGFN